MKTRNKAMALLAVTGLAFGGLALSSATAEAAPGWRQGGRYYGHGIRHRRGNVGLGIAAGVLAAGALAAAAAPAYAYPSYGYDPGYAPVYYRRQCYWTHQAVWDPYWGGYVNQRVKVCR